MRILQVCHKPPLPATDGGTVAMHSLTQGLLDAGHSVRICTLETAKHPFQPNLLSDSYRTQVQPRAVFADTEVKPLAAGAAVFSSYSYHISRFDVPAMHELLQETVVDYQPDIVLFESLFTAPYLETVRKSCKAQCVYRSHNVESVLWENRLNEYPLHKRPWLKNITNKLARYEFATINQFDGVVTISQDDLDTLRQKGMRVPATAVPFGVNQTIESVHASDQKNILFIGSLDWQPNTEALTWFTEEVWKPFHAQHSDYTFQLAGRNATAAMRELGNVAGIRFRGEITDALAFLAEGDILVSPLFTGSGQRIKVLEALAQGKAVVASSVALQGLDVEPGIQVEVAENGPQFVDTLHHLVSEHTKRERLMQAGLDWVKAHHTATQTTGQFLQFVEGLRS